MQVKELEQNSLEWQFDSKFCGRCQTEKPRTSFYARRNRTNGLASICKDCSKSEVLSRQKTSQWKEWRKTNLKTCTVKIAARDAVKQEIKMKRMIRPDRCESCRESVFVQGHHEDYSKPLEVNWLCQTCHTGIHNG